MCLSSSISSQRKSPVWHGNVCSHIFRFGSLTVFYIAFLFQSLNIHALFLKTTWDSPTNLGKKPAGIMKRKAGLRSPAHRKVSMLTQATIQALANHPPKWTSPVWYCNVFRSSRNFKKTNPELLSTEKPWNIHRRFSSCYNKKNITGEKQAHNTFEYQPN